MNTLMENGTQMTLDQWMPEACPKPIVGVLDAHVRISLLQENEQDLTGTDHPSLEKYLESSGKKLNRIDPNGLSMKTLRECLVQMGVGDYLEILLEMDELGYDIEWQIFNSKYFGVPQNRERVYTVGHFRRYGSRKIFPIGGTDGEDSFHGIDILAHYDGYRRNTQTFNPYGITETLSTCGGGGREHHVAIPVNVNLKDGIVGGAGK